MRKHIRTLWQHQGTCMLSDHLNGRMDKGSKPGYPITLTQEVARAGKKVRTFEASFI